MSQTSYCHPDEEINHILDLVSNVGYRYIAIWKCWGMLILFLFNPLLLHLVISIRSVIIGDDIH